jgi:hypothetical protein
MNKILTDKEKREKNRIKVMKWRRKKGVLPKGTVPVWNKKYFTEEEKKTAKKNLRKEYNKKNENKIKKYQISYNKKYYEKNKEKIKANTKKYQELHKNKIKNQRENHKKERLLYKKMYRKLNKDKIKQYNYIYIKNQLKTNINFKLAHYLRNRLRQALHSNQKSGSAVQDLGCSIPKLKTHLESKFQEGMSWNNWGIKGWHIDHIIPLASFNLQDKKEFLKACHYTNLQPLWAEENLKKKNNYIQGY